MNESILNTVKKMIGFEDDYNVFDTDLIVCINAAFSTLRQIGVGPEGGFSISDASAVWEDFGASQILLDWVKQYVYLKAKNTFDPPASATIMNAYNETMKELEWRMNLAAEVEE